MNYFISIKTAILVFPLIAFLFSIPFILHQYHKYGAINFFRVLIIYSFILYLITIYFLVILPLPNKEDVVYKSNMIRLMPFGFVRDFIRESSFVLTSPKTYLIAIKEPCFYVVVFNIFMTIPFGMYLRYYFNCSFKKTLIISFILSLFFELTQLSGLYGIYSYPYRVFDVDDLIMNTLGGVIGFLIMGVLDNFLPTRNQIDEDSFRAGEVVSGLRRITIFGLDLFLYVFISLFLKLFINSKWLFGSVFIIYYVIYPYLGNGYTLGSKFLGVKLVFKKRKLINLMLRILCLYVYYIGILYMLMILANFIIKLNNIDGFKVICLYLFILFGMMIFYLINVITLIKNKKIYYDYLFEVEYVSTIRKNRLEDIS